MTARPGRSSFKHTPLTIDGVTRTYQQWEEECGVAYAVIRDRVKRGYTGKAILRPTTPRRTTPKPKLYPTVTIILGNARPPKESEYQ